MSLLLILPVFLPILLGAILMMSKTEDNRVIHKFSIISVSVFALTTWALILFSGSSYIEVVRFTDNLVLAFRLDGFSRVFAGMVSVLWVFTTLYAFEYMKHEGMEKKFFGFFIMSFGVVMGVAFARNLFTMYIFYEYLTFATLPLVMHQMSRKSRYAGKIYLLYSITGGAAVFVAMMFLIKYGVSLEFVYGGSVLADADPALRWVFLAAFAGFGVKAAIFPLYYWLPTASVAPTPVTALLHAVAVVKSGVFAIARLIYCVYGVSFLSGTFVQDTLIIVASFTILFGSSMALRTRHLKRRLAYSTVSNLSYIILGLSFMNSGALTGAMTHMVFHGVIKITLFFCAGAILIRTGAEYIDDLHGYAKRMPKTMFCFTVCGLGLIGVPPFAAFTSKYIMAVSAIEGSVSLGYVGIAALIISEVLTALYIFQPILAAYFPDKSQIAEGGNTGDPGNVMIVPMIILSVVSLALAAYPQWLISVIETLVGGAL